MKLFFVSFLTSCPQAFGERTTIPVIFLPWWGLSGLKASTCRCLGRSLLFKVPRYGNCTSQPRMQAVEGDFFMTGE